MILSTFLLLGAFATPTPLGPPIALPYRRVTINHQVIAKDTKKDLVLAHNRDLIKRFDNTDIAWTVIERQILLCLGLFTQGKRLRLNICFNYVEDSNLTVGRITDRKGRSSVTTRILKDRDA
ncbi:hypothetical protein N7512_002038 [Penicillium capsulatum]|nr:hypothetical protein N7512_002038 [Penicillium capsulatum]